MFFYTNCRVCSAYHPRWAIEANTNTNIDILSSNYIRDNHINFWFHSMAIGLVCVISCLLQLSFPVCCNSPSHEQRMADPATPSPSGRSSGPSPRQSTCIVQLQAAQVRQSSSAAQHPQPAPRRILLSNVCKKNLIIYRLFRLRRYPLIHFL